MVLVITCLPQGNLFTTCIGSFIVLMVPKVEDTWRDSKPLVIFIAVQKGNFLELTMDDVASIQSIRVFKEIIVTYFTKKNAYRYLGITEMLVNSVKNILKQIYSHYFMTYGYAKVSRTLMKGVI